MKSPAGKRESKTFTYDKVLDSDSTQADAYLEGGRSSVRALLDGFNGTIFAYGQSGSGKTFTMLGGKVREEGLVIATPNNVECLGLSWHHIPHDGGNI